MWTLWISYLVICLPTADPSHVYPCPSQVEWFTLNDQLFGVTHGRTSDLDKAKRCCANTGEHVRLAVLTFSGPDIAAHLSQTFPTSGNAQGEFWVGAERDSYGHFRWSTGSYVGSHLWAHGEPSYSENCARLRLDGDLYGAECPRWGNYFVLCQGYNPSGTWCSCCMEWFSINGNIFGVASRGSSLDSARQCCTKFGPDFRLAVLDNVTLAFDVFDYLKYFYNYNEYWVDATRSGYDVAKDFTWPSGAPVDDRLWYTYTYEPQATDIVARIDLEVYTPRLRGYHDSQVHYRALCQHYPDLSGEASTMTLSTEGLSTDGTSTQAESTTTEEITTRSGSTSLGYDQTTTAKAPPDSSTTVNVASPESLSQRTTEGSSGDTTILPPSSVAMTTEQETSMAMTTDQETSVAMTTDQETSVAMTTDQETSVAMTTDQETSMAMTTEQESSVAVTTEQESSVAVTTDKDHSVAVRTGQQGSNQDRLVVMVTDQPSSAARTTGRQNYVSMTTGLQHSVAMTTDQKGSTHRQTERIVFPESSAAVMTTSKAGQTTVPEHSSDSGTSIQTTENKQSSVSKQTSLALTTDTLTITPKSETTAELQTVPLTTMAFTGRSGNTNDVTHGVTSQPASEDPKPSTEGPAVSAGTPHHSNRRPKTNLCAVTCPRATATAKCVAPNKATVEVEVESLRHDLILNKQELSSHARKLTSATDERQSAKIVGSTGVSLLISAFLFILFLDLNRLLSVGWSAVLPSPRSRRKEGN